jgi:hypothetical protein
MSETLTNQIIRECALGEGQPWTKAEMRLAKRAQELERELAEANRRLVEACGIGLAIAGGLCENPDEWLRGHEKRLRELEKIGEENER